MPFGVAPRIRSAVVCGLSTEAESERDAGGVMIRKFAFNAATQIKACFRSASLALVGDALSCSRGDKHPQARSTPHECYLIQVAGFPGVNHPPPHKTPPHTGNPSLWRFFFVSRCRVVSLNSHRFRTDHLDAATRALIVSANTATCLAVTTLSMMDVERRRRSPRP